MTFANRPDRLVLRHLTLAIVLPSLLATGCSLQRIATRAAGRALAGGGAVWSGDDDPQLVREAMPFALKTIESLLASAPDDPALLLAACSGFTQYAQGFLAQEADELEATDFAAARLAHERVARLLARATGYGLRGLELRAPGIAAALRAPDGVDAALAKLDRTQVPLLYWTAAAWGSRIARAKDDPSLAGDLAAVERLMRRARELEAGFGAGAIADFYILWEGGRPAAGGGSPERARAALDEALRLAAGHRAAPLVAYAETVTVATQDRAEFRRLLERALALDVAKTGEHQLANLLAQRRARWLLARADELFVE